MTLTAVSHGMATAACTVGAPTSTATITIANSRMISFATIPLHLECRRSFFKTKFLLYRPPALRILLSLSSLSRLSGNSRKQTHRLYVSEQSHHGDRQDRELIRPTSSRGPASLVDASFASPLAADTSAREFGGLAFTPLVLSQARARL
ncbi:MAG: hypothetical protein ACYCUI_14575 [Vulcanimicrobiaceae bacterium]